MGFKKSIVSLKYRHLLILALAAMAPFVPALLSGAFPADPYAELPVKLWVYHHFAASGSWLGGSMNSIGFPQGGPLNNPDIFGTLWMALTAWMARPTSYSLMLATIQLLNMLSLYTLAKHWTRDHQAALTAALCFGLCSALQGYVIGGAITDMLHVWPYPWAIWAGLKAFERQSYRWGIWAALFFGLGFITCPYNAVVFSPVALPIAWHLVQKKAIFHATGLKIAALLLFTVGLVLGIYALQLQSVMSAPDSQMSTELVQSTRHQWPFQGLMPDHPDRYVATLLDYVTGGKERLIIRDSGARFYRSYSLGWLGLGFALWALRQKRTWLWGSIFGLGILLSLGPFLSLNAKAHLSFPSNPVYLVFFYLWPGTEMILEPFRYQLLATLGLCILIAIGLRELKHTAIRLGLMVLLPLELCLFSTAPFPQPQSHFETAQIYHQLPTINKGAVIELPYHHQQSRLFVRQHFVNQLAHQQPIINSVAGFLPGLFFENSFLAPLMAEDAPHPVPTGRHQSPYAGAQELYQAGFRSLVFTPKHMIHSEAAARTQAQIEAVLGPPILVGDDRFIYAFGPLDTDSEASDLE